MFLEVLSELFFSHIETAQTQLLRLALLFLRLRSLLFLLLILLEPNLFFLLDNWLRDLLLLLRKCRLLRSRCDFFVLLFRCLLRHWCFFFLLLDRFLLHFFLLFTGKHLGLTPANLYAVNRLAPADLLALDLLAVLYVLGHLVHE